MDQQLLLIKTKNNICTLTLNRPEKKNSLSLELVELLGSTLQEMAEEIAGNAPLALKGIKKVINLLMQSNRLDETQTKEAQAIFKTALFSKDMQEGQAAFLEKRKPRFKGK